MSDAHMHQTCHSVGCMHLPAFQFNSCQDVIVLSKQRNHTCQISARSDQRKAPWK